jgi:capsular polysaccharide biosynthesis protein
LTETGISLLDIWSLIRRRWIIMLAAGLFCGAVVGLYTYFFIEPVYEAKVSMYVYNQERENSAVTTSELSASKSLVDTYIVILKSNTVLDAVIKALDLPYTEKQLNDMITASAMNNTEAFEIVVSNTDPALAQKIANSIAEIAPEQIIRVVKAGSVEVIDEAQLPGKPASPSMKKNVAIGILIGLVISFGICLLLQTLDTAVWLEEDLQGLFDIPVLGSIPQITLPDSTKKSKEARAAQ